MVLITTLCFYIIINRKISNILTYNILDPNSFYGRLGLEKFEREIGISYFENIKKPKNVRILSICLSLNIYKRIYILIYLFLK